MQRNVYRRHRHGEHVAAALEVVVRQDGAAHDGQVRVGADEVVRELRHKVEQLLKRAAVDVHGLVLFVEHDAVLVVVQVGGILEVPRLAAQVQVHKAVVLARREGRAAPRVAGVLHAQHAGRIAGGLLQPRRRDVARVLLGLGQVDGDVQLAHHRGRLVLDVARDVVHADVVDVAAQLVEPVGGVFRALGVAAVVEFAAHLGGPGGDAAHQPGGKRVALALRVGAHAAPHRVLGQRRKVGRRGGRQLDRLRLIGTVGLLRRIQPQHVQQQVAAEGQILPLDQMIAQRKGQQPLQRMICHCHDLLGVFCPLTPIIARQAANGKGKLLCRHGIMLELPAPLLDGWQAVSA